MNAYAKTVNGSLWEYIVLVSIVVFVLLDIAQT